MSDDDPTAGTAHEWTERLAKQEPQGGSSAAALERCVADLVNAVDKGVADEVSPYALIPSEFNLLRVCANGPCAATQLAGVLPVDASRISRMVTRLVNMGLVRRQRLRSDRRVVLLHLTDKGQELTSRVNQRVQSHVSGLLNGVSDREMRVFESVTSKIVANYATLKQSR
ncbi:MAG: MarR family transcriptional regulator [Chloroflexi bacterium]|nr:MarR family transcriptional regulator [Chloroflexota bacterium]MCY3958301.1 MarR family transcriptional regulator [Chloroflexota bacterium]